MDNPPEFSEERIWYRDGVDVILDWSRLSFETVDDVYTCLYCTMDYCDNGVEAQVGVAFDPELYFAQRDPGCCGRINVYVEPVEDGPYIVGCNYGH